MAVSKNKERLTISLDKKLIKYIKNKARINNNTVSEEIANMFEKEFWEKNDKI